MIGVGNLRKILMMCLIIFLSASLAFPRVVEASHNEIHLHFLGNSSPGQMNVYTQVGCHLKQDIYNGYYNFYEFTMHNWVLFDIWYTHYYSGDIVNETVLGSYIETVWYYDFYCGG